MSRRRAAEKRKVLPDMKYNSVLLTRFINNVIRQGKKSLAERIVYGALDKIHKERKVDPFEVFNNALNNVKPYLEVVSTRVGGANYQVPVPVNERRAYALAARWVIGAAIKRSEKTMTTKLAEELFDASHGRGGAWKKREDTHKMAEANKAFAHFGQQRSLR